MRKSSLRTRFMRQVQVRQIDDCWEWFGWRDKNGYGIFRENSHNYRAHVASLLLWRGIESLPWPTEASVGGPMVLHRCDRPWCVNPDHLYPGDAAQNAKDQVDRGRMSIGAVRREMLLKNYPKLFKLTQEAVDDIRARVARGEQQKDLAIEYGVQKPHIHRIVKMERWKP